jgi:hypothetical protein
MGIIRKHSFVESRDGGPTEPADGEPEMRVAQNVHSDEAKPTPMLEGGENLRRFTIDVLSSFVEALETAPAHLYANERQEVISGLVVRAGVVTWMWGNV